ncbi:MAG: STAS/SEC14 domain-containing protein [Rhodobacteraceae bacterium]|jgi:hypothetical protein|nr:STAS/SEC14 domain-containing protein [Paracoccaceae bacterium]
MIVIERQSPDGYLEMQVSGRVTEADYQDVVIPAIERGLHDTDQLRVLLVIGPDFEGYSAGAAWADTKLGLSHWRGFERAAVATDNTFVANATRVFGAFMPCPVKVFPLAEADAARRWLEESLGTIHLREGPGNLLRAELVGTLDRAAYDRAESRIDGFIAGHERIRLIVDLREFDGWQGLGALGEHLSLMREHRHAPERVAVLGQTGWQQMGQRVFGRMLKAETRFFDAADAQAAEAWVTG